MALGIRTSPGVQKEHHFPKNIVCLLAMYVKYVLALRRFTVVNSHIKSAAINLRILSCTGCDSAFGMANDKKNITDNQISASSVYGTNFAQNARLNSRSGWCAQTQDQNQFIQV